MNRTDILQSLSDIIRDLADDDSLEITEATVAEDVDEWDSLFQVKLMIEVERKYGVRFETHEINVAQNVGELIDQILTKKA